MDSLKKDLLNTLYSKYGSMIVGKKQASEIIGRSRASMDNDRYQGIGIPYLQSREGATVKYALHELVTYIVDSSIKVALWIMM